MHQPFIHCICLVALAVLAYNTCYADTVVLGGYDLSRGIGVYSPERASSCGVRFPLENRIVIDSVRFMVNGVEGSRLALRVFGDEGGFSVPTVSRDIVEPIIVTLEQDGLQWLTVDVRDNIDTIDHAQIYVVIERREGNAFIVTDQVAVAPCVSEGERYGRQIVRNASGVWENAPYSSIMDMFAQVIDDHPPYAFHIDTVVAEYPYSVSRDHERFFITTADTDGDGRIEIITPLGIAQRNAQDSFSFRKSSQSELQNIEAVIPFSSADQNKTYIVMIQLDSESQHGGMVSTRTSGVRTTTEVIQLPGRGVCTFSYGTEYGSTAARKILCVVADKGTYSSKIYHIDLENPRNLQDEVHVPFLIWNGTVAREAGTGDVTAFYVGVDANRNIVRLRQTSLFDPQSRELTVVASIDTVDLVNAPPSERILSDAHRAGDIASIEPRIRNRSMNSSSVFMSNLDDDASKNYAAIGDLHLGNASALVSGDLDADGNVEFIVMTDDTCRHPVVLSMRGASAYERRTIKSLACLSGARDVAITDVDGDGDQDIIGYRGNRLYILRNQSKQRSSLVRTPIPVNHASLVATDTFGFQTVELIPGSGRGRNIHIANSDIHVPNALLRGARWSLVMNDGHFDVTPRDSGNKEAGVTGTPRIVRRGDENLTIVASSRELITSIAVIDLQGRELITSIQTTPRDIVEIDLTELDYSRASGSYTLHVLTTSSKYVIPFVRIK